MDVTIDPDAVKQARLLSSHFLDEDLRLFSSELRDIMLCRSPQL